MVYSSIVAPPMSGPSVSRRPLIKVVVRVRPAAGDTCWVKQIDERTLQTTNHRNVKEFLHYEFEQVYGPEAGQSLIYEGCAQSLVSSVLDGRNVCIFAYGPTGSGKTHTMLGTVEDPGIIPMCVQEFFTALREWDRTYQLRFSYLEIYNEKVRDLLQPPHSSVDLPIREDHHHNIFVAGLSERSVDNMDQFNDAFTPAAKNRRTAATSLNKRSSRSHALLMLKVLRLMPSGGTAVVGKMNLIDLAGSEDNRRTGNAGIRLKESSAINTSLLALGQVVEALRKGQSCVPYRASKLTRLLQDSLGGVTQTCMIITVSPEQCHFQETHTTLGFARKSKKIVTSAKLPEEEAFTPCCHKREEVSADVMKPVPFLSPLLREQRKFEGALCKRLERLEQRLLEQMSQSVVNQSVVSVVSTDTRVDSNDRNVNDALDTTYAVETSDVTDQSLSSSTCDNEMNGDRSVTLKTPFRLDLSHYSSDISSGDVTLLSDRNFPETPIMDTSENSFGNSCHDYSHMTSGCINFGRGCNDDELKPFSPGGAAAIDYTGFGTATTKLTTVMTEIKSYNRRNHDASLLSTTVSSSSVKMHKLKRKSVFADGSSRLDNFLSVDEVLSCSPLFLKPPLVKRWRHAPFVSTAAPRASVTTVPRDRSPLQPINGSYLVNENTKDAQKEHNDYVLHILNAGSLKELQSLQTIGQKRAQQIMNWRTLQGRFHKISDLKKVPGISIDKFLSANLIED